MAAEVETIDLMQRLADSLRGAPSPETLEEAYTLDKIRSERNDLRDLATLAQSYLPVGRCPDCGRLSHNMYCCVHCGSGN